MYGEGDSQYLAGLLPAVSGVDGWGLKGSLKRKEPNPLNTCSIFICLYYISIVYSSLGGLQDFGWVQRRTLEFVSGGYGEGLGATVWGFLSGGL